jgi:hypothetical protein
MKSMHGGGAGRAAAGAGAAARRGPGRPPASAALSPAVRTLQDTLGLMLAEREQLNSQVEALDQVLGVLGASSGGNSRTGRAGMTAGRGRGGRRRARRGTAILGILRALDQQGPLKPARVAELSGVKPTTVSTALDNLRRKKHASRGSAGWALTAGGRADLAAREKAG